jgi:predicted dehydrogenase
VHPLERPPRIGFLGAGLIATFHSKMLRASGVDHERGPVHDPDPGRADAFVAAAGGHVAATEDEVLDGCDAVYVCTWTSEHPRLVEAAARRGVHVFCEKPLAVDLATAERMLAVVESAGIVHQVGLVLRRSPAFLVARDLVADPAAGRTMAAVLRDDQYLPTQGQYRSTWRADRRLAGSGTLLEHSIHDVDLLRALVGDVASVGAHEANFHGHDGIEDVVAATVRFATGALGTLTSVWHDNLARPSLRRVELLCERRHVVVDGHDWFGPVSWTDHDGATGSLEGEALVDRATALVDGSLNPDGDFVRAVALGTPASPDFRTALDAHRVVDAIYRAATSGTTVDLDPAGPTR